MKLGEIIIAKLKELGADGLVNVELECGCGIDGLAPCESCNMDDCESAKWRECNTCEHNGNCEYQSEYEVHDGCFYEFPIEAGK